MTPALHVLRSSASRCSGLAALGWRRHARWSTGGADVTCWDDNGAVAREKCSSPPDFHVADLSKVRTGLAFGLVRPVAGRAAHPSRTTLDGLAKAQVPPAWKIIGDIEIFCARACAAPRTERTFHRDHRHERQIHDDRADQRICSLLSVADVQMGGNIGVPGAGTRTTVDVRAYMSLELSTFQIDLTPSLHPSVGVLLNLAPDHLDRHGSMARYAAIKERLVCRFAIMRSSRPMMISHARWRIG